MKLKFSKMHCIGNDFVVIDGITQCVHLTASQISQWADRHTGIGFDQLLLIEKPATQFGDFAYRIFNQDGTEAEQCGNGVRCCAQFIWDHQLAHQPTLEMVHLKGITTVYQQSDGSIRANMGNPIFEPQHIPFVAKKTAKTYPVVIHQTTYALSVLSLGNPHATLFVKNLATTPVNEIGIALQQHDRFPQKINVGFVEIRARDTIKLRVFERGVGETLACGSGACAAVVNGILLGHLEATVAVQMALGTLWVTWKGTSTDPVWLTGPVATSFTGQIA